MIKKKCKSETWWDINLKKKMSLTRVRNLEDPNDNRCGAHLNDSLGACFSLEETHKRPGISYVVNSFINIMTFPRWMGECSLKIFVFGVSGPKAHAPGPADPNTKGTPFCAREIGFCWTAQLVHFSSCFSFFFFYPQRNGMSIWRIYCDEIGMRIFYPESHITRKFTNLGCCLGGLLGKLMVFSFPFCRAEMTSRILV